MKKEPEVTKVELTLTPEGVEFGNITVESEDGDPYTSILAAARVIGVDKGQDLGEVLESQLELKPQTSLKKTRKPAPQKSEPSQTDTSDAADTNTTENPIPTAEELLGLMSNGLTLTVDGEEVTEQELVDLLQAEQDAIPEEEKKGTSPFEQVQKCVEDPTLLVTSLDTVPEDGKYISLGDALTCTGCQEMVIAGYPHPKTGRDPMRDACLSCWKQNVWFIDLKCTECKDGSPFSLMNG